MLDMVRPPGAASDVARIRAVVQERFGSPSIPVSHTAPRPQLPRARTHAQLHSHTHTHTHFTLPLSLSPPFTRMHASIMRVHVSACRAHTRTHYVRHIPTHAHAPRHTNTDTHTHFPDQRRRMSRRRGRYTAYTVYKILRGAVPASLMGDGHESRGRSSPSRH